MYQEATADYPQKEYFCEMVQMLISLEYADKQKHRQRDDSVRDRFQSGLNFQMAERHQLIARNTGLDYRSNQEPVMCSAALFRISIIHLYILS